MKYRIPCEWRLKTIEEVDARDLMAAQDKVAMLRRPKSMVGAIIEPIIGVVDFQELERMYPTPEPPNPMIGWECTNKPGAYEGGRWEKKICGCTVIVSGDTGPIEVGMGWTTYHWRVSKDSEDNDLSSKIGYNQIEMARDAALAAAKKWGEIGMKISKEYGPQFDPTDGTVGELQLVKRWVIVRKSDGQMWQARQGRYTYPSEAETIARKVEIERNNAVDLLPAGGLGIEPRWCYPGHFDPAGPVE